MRKCEKVVSNMFSLKFIKNATKHLNFEIWIYFLKHCQECYKYLKIYSFPNLNILFGKKKKNGFTAI